MDYKLDLAEGAPQYSAERIGVKSSIIDILSYHKLVNSL